MPVLVSMRTLFAALIVLSVGLANAEESPNFYLLEYRPGENWNGNVAFGDQPGIKAHKAYLEELYLNDVVRMSGETAELPGEVVLLRVGSMEQARAVGERDPAVVNQILHFEVTGWRVDISSMRHMKRRQQPIRDPNEPFRLERLDPDSPINLKN